MSDDLLERSNKYAPFTGFVYIFNLIVGTGALTLPSAFQKAGWVLSSAIIIMLAFMSYLTTTFVIESMAAANALVHWKRLKRLKRSGDHGSVSDELIQKSLQSMAEESPINISSTSLPTTSSAAMAVDNISRLSHSNSSNDIDVDENQPLLEQESREREIIERIPQNVSSYYNITEIIEMGKMASLFFNKTGKTLFYLCITVYLYGDLAIYGAAVAKSLRDVACTYSPVNGTSRWDLNETDQCWPESTVDRLNAYRVFLALFVAVVGPFAFCNVTKTKYLQILTSIMRWLAFGSMVTLAVIRLANGKSANPPRANFSGLPNLFGACVYSFMCHHSLPSLVTPISSKRHLNWLVSADYLLILLFYFLLAFTGIFAFKEIDDLYTLNFQPQPNDPWFLETIHYFLILFPVFTLSTNFPIIAITLRNNLKSLFLTDGRMYSWCTRKCIFPLLALIPPVAVAFATNKLDVLVGFTGAYAGAGIQYIVPAFLVHYSRKVTRTQIGIGVRNHHRSFFRHTFWVVFVNVWAIGCVVIVTANNISNLIRK